MYHVENENVVEAAPTTEWSTIFNSNSILLRIWLILEVWQYLNLNSQLFAQYISNIEQLYVMMHFDEFFVESFTDWGLVAWYGDRAGSTLTLVMACFLTTPSHYLNQCWLLVSHIFWHSPENNFVGNAWDYYPLCEFKNYWFKITATSAEG